MAEYAKTKVDNMITVSSIGTALRKDLRNRTLFAGESHNFPEIFYMAEEGGKTVVNGNELSLEAGQLVIYAPNAFHEKGTGGIVEIISFETDTPLPDSLYNRPITLSGSQRVRFRALIEQAMPLFERRIGVKGMMLKSSADPYALQSVKNMLELFLLNLIKPSECYEKSRIHIVTDYMVKNINRTLTLSDISTELGISESSLKQLIGKACGKPPMAYFTALKIEEAKRLLANTPMNITEVSERLGFSSVHHFSRTFRQKTGVTPTQYAKTSRL